MDSHLQLVWEWAIQFIARIRIILTYNLGAGKKPKAIGVVFKDENGELHRAFLSGRKSEVILSSGAIGSPHLLMLSGIGPKEELDKKNIEVVLYNDFVGRGMSDNPMNAIFIPTKRPVEQSLIQIVGITKMGSFIEASSGFSQSSDSIRCNHGFLSAEVCLTNSHYMSMDTTILRLKGPEFTVSWRSVMAVVGPQF